MSDYAVGPLVHCDVSELVNLPPLDGVDIDRLPSLDGVSAKQVNWGEVQRGECLEQWESDLPENVLLALGTIIDAAWWIANKDAEVADIKWPVAWTAQRLAPIRPAAATKPAVVKAFEEAKATVRQEHVVNFDEFARKMCKSPELAYLTIMALAVRQNTDPKVRSKYDEVRATIQGHLTAIDRIANGT